MVGREWLYQMIRYTTTVQLSNDPDENDYYINIPEEVLKILNWNEGDTLDWQISDSKQIVITKIKDAEQSQEEPRDFDERYDQFISARDNYLQTLNEETYQEQSTNYVTEATTKDWEDFWFSPEKEGHW